MVFTLSKECQEYLADKKKMGKNILVEKNQLWKLNKGKKQLKKREVNWEMMMQLKALTMQEQDNL